MVLVSQQQGLLIKQGHIKKPDPLWISPNAEALPSTITHINLGKLLIFSIFRFLISQNGGNSASFHEILEDSK